MLARQVVLLTPPKSPHPSQLISRQQSAPVSPLAATLMDLPASVANKRLTAWLSPLDATLTKTGGWGRLMVNQHPPDLDVWTFRRSDVPTIQRTLHSLFSLFAQRASHNSFAITGILTLSKNSRVVPQLFPFWNSSLATILKFYLFTCLRTLLHFFALSQISTLFLSSGCALFAENHRGWGWGFPNCSSSALRNLCALCVSALSFYCLPLQRLPRSGRGVKSFFFFRLSTFDFQPSSPSTLEFPEKM